MGALKGLGLKMKQLLWKRTKTVQSIGRLFRVWLLGCMSTVNSFCCKSVEVVSANVDEFLKSSMYVALTACASVSYFLTCIYVSG